ncbi:O-methyltransferase [Halobacillus sp. A1]|uniref:O-methyltransferase n=1 Tax=Halobacillus sp. A1 TaxID=2880262 RepID=UPI0020A677E3|nr:O-methyltransferase [Halobacillus sp. A1]MCP3030401.1 O-methyltransferase [Halobacillus sp. A1]
MKQEEYLHSLLHPASNDVRELEKYAKEHNVPIMEPLGIEFLMQLLRVHRPNNILEIGAAIGYSALRMVEALPESQIVTVERDEKRYEEAKQNIRFFGKEQQIHLLAGDALHIKEQIEAYGPFDFLFIDAAKGKYEDFFRLYSPLVSEHGIIVSDNVLFKGYVADPSKAPERLEKMVSKIIKFNQLLNEHPDYNTTIVPIGDGVAITTRKS